MGLQVGTEGVPIEAAMGAAVVNRRSAARAIRGVLVAGLLLLASHSR